MGTGPITKAREVEHGGVRRAVATAKPTLDFSPLAQTADAAAGALRMHGKMYASFAKHVANLGDAIVGAAKEYQRYENRVREDEERRRMAMGDHLDKLGFETGGEFVEERVGADGEAAMVGADGELRRDGAYGLDAPPEEAVAKGDGLTPYRRRSDAARRRGEALADEEEKKRKGGL